MNGTPSGAVMVTGLVMILSFCWCGGIGAPSGSLMVWCEQCVQPAELLLVNQPVLVDPGGECLELRRIQVHGSALGVPRPGDQPRLFEHLNVLRDRLLGDLERIGQLVDRGRAPAEAGDHPAPHRIGQGGEGPVEPVVGGGIDDHVVNSLALSTC